MVIGLRGIPDVQGGVEKHVEHLYPLLVSSGCEVDVIVRSPYVPSHLKSWKKIGVHRLWAPRIPGLEALIHSFLGVLYAAIMRPDILHIHAIGPAIVTPIARLFGLRVVVTHHGPDYDREKWGMLARALLRLGERWGMKYADGRIVISGVIREIVKNKYGLNSHLIPNGVELPVIPDSSDALVKYGLVKGRYVISVSRFVPEKRHLDLIDAFKQACLPGWKLVLVGNADHESEYSRRVEQESGKTPGVVLTGFLSGIALRELYANAGIFVLASSHEGLPIAMLEALSYGVPVLASNIPANLEVGLGQGNYFELGNKAQLADVLKDFSEKHRTAAEKENTRAWVSKKYNWVECANKTHEVYARIMRLESIARK